MALFEWRLGRARAGALAVATCGAVFARSAAAQQQTFHLDRLEVPGAPDDGLVLFRPVTHHEATFFAQLGLGLAINPLRMSNVSKDAAVLRASPTNLVTMQISTYLSAGVELLNRLTLGFTFPAASDPGGQPAELHEKPIVDGWNHGVLHDWPVARRHPPRRTLRLVSQRQSQPSPRAPAERLASYGRGVVDQLRR